MRDATRASRKQAAGRKQKTDVRWALATNSGTPSSIYRLLRCFAQRELTLTVKTRPRYNQAAIKPEW